MDRPSILVACLLSLAVFFTVVAGSYVATEHSSATTTSTASTSLAQSSTLTTAASSAATSSQTASSATSSSQSTTTAVVSSTSTTTSSVSSETTPSGVTTVTSGGSTATIVSTATGTVTTTFATTTVASTTATPPTSTATGVTSIVTSTGITTVHSTPPTTMTSGASTVVSTFTSTATVAGSTSVVTATVTRSLPPVAGVALARDLQSSALFLAPISWVLLAGALVWRGRIRSAYSEMGFGPDVFELFMKMKGGATRIKVLNTLTTPKDRLQLAQELGVDWKTVDRHVQILNRYGFVKESSAYGTVRLYEVTPLGKMLLNLFDDLGSSDASPGGNSPPGG